MKPHHPAAGGVGHDYIVLQADIPADIPAGIEAAEVVDGNVLERREEKPADDSRGLPITKRTTRRQSGRVATADEGMGQFYPSILRIGDPHTGFDPIHPIPFGVDGSDPIEGQIPQGRGAEVGYQV